MSTPSSDNVMLGRGAVLFRRRTNGAYTGGFRHLGNCDQFGIGFEAEELIQKDYTQQTASPYKRVITSTEIPLTIAGFEFDAFIFSLAVMGDQTTYSQSAATVTDTLVPSTYTNIKGQFYGLSKRNVSGLSLTQGTATLGTADYELFNSHKGIVKLKDGGVAADGTAVVAVYTAAAISGTAALDVVRGATQSAIEGQILFLPNNTTGPNWECQAWNVSLTPNGELGLISDEFNKWTLQGTVQSDAAGNYGGSTDSPYFDLTKRA